MGQRDFLGHLVHEPGATDDNLRRCAAGIGEEVPRQRRQASRGKVKEHRRRERVVLGLDRRAVSAQFETAAAGEAQRLGISDLGIARHADAQGIAGHRLGELGIAAVTLDLAPEHKPRGPQQPVLDALRQPRGRIAQMQNHRRIGTTKGAPALGLTRQYLGQRRQRNRIDRVRLRHHRDHRIKRQNPAAIDFRQVAEPGLSRRAALIGADLAQRHDDIGLIVEQVVEPAIGAREVEMEPPDHAPLGRIAERVAETAVAKQFALGAQAVAQGKALDQRGHQHLTDGG